MADKIKNSILILLLATLFLPATEQYFSVVNEGKLGGYFNKAHDVPFSFDQWLDGEYQEQKGAFYNDQLGFRPALVRVKNQLDYSIFDKLHGDWLAPGKEHYLFQTIHINGYYGRDYIGYQSIDERLRKLKAVQDTLAALGKTLIVIHSPCKAYFYPEYIPDEFKSAKKHTTNLETFLRIGDSLGLAQIDFNSWFVSLKNKMTEPLYSKQGIHWSVYGSLLAADSLVRYIERCRKITMPHPEWRKITRTSHPRETDDDLSQTLNLVFPYAKEILSYPELVYPKEARDTRPSVIYIGDSFLFNWINDGLMQHANSRWQVWEHFDAIWDSATLAGAPPGKIDGYDWMGAVKEADCVVIMYTSFNLNDFGDGFIERSYSYFYPGKK